MSASPLQTVVVGFGKVGAGYAADPLMARYYPVATHAQALKKHTGFDWRAVVDPNVAARAAAAADWGVRDTAATLAELPRLDEVEVAVLATPPDARLALLDALPALRAVLVEKPLGVDAASAERFLHACQRRGILLQVNLWRRADSTFRELAGGALVQRIGEPQGATFFYGNGLLNNGTHMVDFARMLFGEVESLQRLGTAEPLVGSPLRGDSSPSFALHFARGLTVSFVPLAFGHYRENGAIIFGTRGRLDILNEGLTVAVYDRQPNRSTSGEWEVASDAAVPMPSTVGTALYEMYANLYSALQGTALPCSPGESALITSRVVDAIVAAPVTGEICPFSAQSREPR